MVNDLIRVPWTSLHSFVAGVFHHLGAPGHDANLAADVIVKTSLRGVDSHGLFLFPAYVERLRRGLIEPQPDLQVSNRDGVALVVDGANGLGQVVACTAMRLSIEQARISGAGIASVRNSNHFGAADYYAMLALDHDMIGVAASNGTAVMAPWGAGEPYLGTNPLAVAVPTDRTYPVVLDMATSVTARSRILQASERDEEIPRGWAIDSEGRPTKDPAEALKGAVLPFAGPKGSALAVIIEVLTGVLSGGAIGPHVRGLHEDLTTPQGTCHLFAAIDVSRFLPMSDFKRRMGTMIEEIKRLRPLAGLEGIILPGEERVLAEEDRLAAGIPVGRAFLTELEKLGRELGVALEV